MRKQPSEDKALYDHIKELWELWQTGNDEILPEETNFDDFLTGYFVCYYKSEPRLVNEAIIYFNNQIIDVWQREEIDMSGIFED